MVEFKSPIRLIGGEKGDHCNYPLQIDPYGNGCMNKCVYCSDPETLVTMVDLSTKMIKDINVGDKIVGLRHNEICDSFVESIWTVHKPVFNVIIENGNNVKCSADHRWLTDRGWKYTKTLNTMDDIHTYIDGVYSKSKVASITKVSDDALLYDIQTSTENFIANGMVSHNCYAQSLLAFRNHWNPESPAETDISKIRKQFETAFNTDRSTKTAGMLRKRVPIRIGGMTDPFLKNEQESRKTLELLEVFKDFQYPYIIFTKGAMVADDEYLELYDPDLTYVQVTITSNNQELVDQIEPNASTTSDRMDAVSKLIEAGIRTGVRIGPIIPIWPDGTLAAGDDPGSASLDYFSFGLVDEICSLAPSIVIAEMCRFTPFIFNQFDAIGINVRQLINEHSITKSATKFISVAERLAYYTRMKETCDEAEVAFSVCELDNFDKFKHLWAVEDDCCGMKGTIKGADKTWWSDL